MFFSVSCSFKLQEICISALDVGGGGRDPREKKGLCTKAKKWPKKNLISVWRRRLFQHYWYIVPVLYIVKFHLMGVSRVVTVIYWYTSDQKMGSELKKWRKRFEVRISTPAPHVSAGPVPHVSSGKKERKKGPVVDRTLGLEIWSINAPNCATNSLWYDATLFSVFTGCKTSNFQWHHSMNFSGFFRSWSMRVGVTVFVIYLK